MLLTFLMIYILILFTDKSFSSLPKCKGVNIERTHIITIEEVFYSQFTLYDNLLVYIYVWFGGGFFHFKVKSFALHFLFRSMLRPYVIKTQEIHAYEMLATYM